MTKIVTAGNAMIANPTKITSVIQARDEFFFLYNNKHKWSISRQSSSTGCVLYYYPGGEPLDYLAGLSDNWDQSIPMVMYSSDEIGTKEARDTFNELFNLVSSKAFGIDEALDDIISDFF